MNIEVVHMKDYGKVSAFIGFKEAYVYCGRPSVLGNPFNKWNHGTREQNIEACSKDIKWNAELDKFVDWVKAQDLDELKLGCYCAPKACHCDLIKNRLDSELGEA